MTFGIAIEPRTSRDLAARPEKATQDTGSGIGISSAQPRLRSQRRRLRVMLFQSAGCVVDGSQGIPADEAGKRWAQRNSARHRPAESHAIIVLRARFRIIGIEIGRAPL